MKKKKKRDTKYSPEFKISVIMDMRENHLSYRETVRKHWQTKNRLYVKCWGVVKRKKLKINSRILVLRGKNE